MMAANLTSHQPLVNRCMAKQSISQGRSTQAASGGAPAHQWRRELSSRELVLVVADPTVGEGGALGEGNAEDSLDERVIEQPPRT